MRGASVSQDMRAVVGQGQAQRVQAAVDDPSQALGNQGPERCHQSKEYLPPIGPRSHFSQVAKDGVADRTAQRVSPWPL